MKGATNETVIAQVTRFGDGMTPAITTTAKRELPAAPSAVCLPLVLILALSTIGCSTTKSAAETTLAQGRTLTDLQYRQVLENLAMFRKFAERQDIPIPWNLKLTSVVTSVADSASPTFSLTWPGISRTLGAGTSRQWQVQWIVTPETNSDVLNALQKTYRLVSTDPAFAADFEQGSAPARTPFGEYDGLYVWPKDGHLSTLNRLVIEVLNLSSVKPEERNLVIPLR